MIGFAAVFGSPLAYDQVEPLKRKLSNSFSAHCHGRFSERIELYLITLFFSGSIEDYQLEGCGQLRYRASKELLVIDLGIPEKRWQGQPSFELAVFLADGVRDAFERAIDRCRKKREALPSLAQTESVTAALSEFLSSA